MGHEGIAILLEENKHPATAFTHVNLYTKKVYITSPSDIDVHYLCAGEGVPIKLHGMRRSISPRLQNGILGEIYIITVVSLAKPFLGWVRLMKWPRVVIQLQVYGTARKRASAGRKAQTNLALR